MRKIILFASLFPMLISCSSKIDNNHKVYLNYGSLIDESSEKINYTQLKSLITDKTSFFLAVYPGENSTCGCWTTFSDNLDVFVKENKEIVYKINYELLEEEKEKYGLNYYNDRPIFALFENGKLFKQWVYDQAKEENDLFKSKAYLKTLINKYSITPKTLFINQTMLDEKIKSDEFMIMYEWKSCPDCTYCLPNVIYPYFQNKNNQNRKDLYIIDLQIKGILLDEEGKFNKNNPNYEAFKNKYGLSEEGNLDYGYNTGYVPTLQYIKNGKIQSSCVYFNDKISKNNDNKYYISSSFFSENRIHKLDYLNNYDGEKVLQGLEVDEDELDINDASISWKKEYAAKKHNPLLRAFLDYYL